VRTRLKSVKCPKKKKKKTSKSKKKVDRPHTNKMPHLPLACYCFTALLLDPFLCIYLTEHLKRRLMEQSKCVNMFNPGG